MSVFPPPPDEWVTVGQSPLEAIAEMMRSRLEAEGIEAVLRGNKASGAAGVINELNISWSNPLSGVEVRVHESDAQAAREILAEVENEPEVEFEPIDDEKNESESSHSESKKGGQSATSTSGLRLYFQIFCALLVGLWAFAGVTAWSQNTNLGFICGIVAFILFMLSSFRPGK